jgi:gliding motility-associated-like protein
MALFAMSQGKYLFQMDFNGCVANDISGFNVPVTTIGSPSCVCSPSGDAFAFAGGNDQLNIMDTTIRFGQAFSVSLVFRPDSDIDDQRIVSYKQDCNSSQGFEITYHGSNHAITFDLFESLTRRVSIEQFLDPKQCWHAVTFIKSGSNFLVYVYGEKVLETQATASFNVGQNGTVIIGSGSCVPIFANPFIGAISDFSIYDEVLPVSEIQRVVISTNQITTPDALIFLGENITPEVDATCATGYTWSPSAGVSDIRIAEPILAPMETTIYQLTIQDGGCAVTDSIRVLVVDPSEVTCEKLILPTAFTPNNDNLNDTYFISNGFVVEKLILFEIFDRWGGKLFSTSDVTMGWDGTHKGKTVMPGVYVFKSEYICNGETKVQVGSFSVLN